MIKEAKSLLNSSYLKGIDVKVTKKNIKIYLDTTEDKLEIIKKAIEKMKSQESIDNRVIYTIILRIRNLYIIKKLIENRAYKKNDFVRIIDGVSKNKDAYKAYLSVKNDQKRKIKVSLEEARRLYVYLKKELEVLKKVIAKSLNLLIKRF